MTISELIEWLQDKKNKIGDADVWNEGILDNFEKEKDIRYEKKFKLYTYSHLNI